MQPQQLNQIKNKYKKTVANIKNAHKLKNAAGQHVV